MSEDLVVEIATYIRKMAAFDSLFNEFSEDVVDRSVRCLLASQMVSRF